MNRLKTAALFLLGLAALSPAAGWSASSIPGDTPVDRVIVKWRDVDPSEEIQPKRVRDLAARAGMNLVGGRTIGGRMSVVHLDHALAGTELDARLAALRADPGVEMVQPDLRMKAYAVVTPNDPLFRVTSSTTGQWYLQSTEIAAIRADQAWSITKGGASPAMSTVVVAVLDTGITDHPDLRNKLLPGYDFVSQDSGGKYSVANDGNGWDSDPSDPGDFMTSADLAKAEFKDGKCGGGTNFDQPTSSSWHGTRVAGLIAADADNGIGIAGTGFNIRVLPVRVLGKCGGFESDVIAGMYWAAGMLIPPPELGANNPPPMNPNPAQIINLSLGSSDACDSAYAAAVSDITDHGVLIVASAGNDGKAVGTPASCPGVLGVAGVRHAGTKVGYSNLGPEISVAAPAGNCVNPTGACLFSLDTTTNDGLTAPGNATYTDRTTHPNIGTSFASPLVAGTAGLMKAVNPALTPAMLIARIKSSARAFPTVSDTSPQPAACQSPMTAPLQNSECICNTQVCGAGLLDANSAVIAAQRPVALAQVVGTVGRNVTLTLDGSQSAVATGRTASFAWTTVGTTGGATTPAIQSANAAVATVLSPSQGSITLRLTVTDNLGGSDFADVTITAAAGGAGATGAVTSSSPPPSTSTGGGGGYMSLPLLLLLGALMASLFARRYRRA